MPLRRTLFLALTAATTAAIAAGLSCARKSNESSVPATTAGTLADESGFVDVVPQADGSHFPARMFYVFETADEQPASRPARASSTAILVRRTRPRCRRPG